MPFWSVKPKRPFSACAGPARRIAAAAPTIAALLFAANLRSRRRRRRRQSTLFPHTHPRSHTRVDLPDLPDRPTAIVRDRDRDRDRESRASSRAARHASRDDDGTFPSSHTRIIHLLRRRHPSSQPRARRRPSSSSSPDRRLGPYPRERYPHRESRAIAFALKSRARNHRASHASRDSFFSRVVRSL